MGAFTGLFGKNPRVAIIEAFAENPDDALSCPDIERITGVSRRAVYYTIGMFIKEGLLVKDETCPRPLRYRLNENDLRSAMLPIMERLIILGRLESEIKDDQEIPQRGPCPEGLLSKVEGPIISGTIVDE